MRTVTLAVVLALALVAGAGATWFTSADTTAFASVAKLLDGKRLKPNSVTAGKLSKSVREQLAYNGVPANPYEKPADGVSGPPGPPGASVVGPAGAASQVPGPASTTPGPAGPMGSACLPQILGCSSDIQGPPGVQGLQGPRGLAGLKGEDASPEQIGNQVLNYCSTHNDGCRGPSGSAGRDGLDSTTPGPRGLTGDTGQRGADGHDAVGTDCAGLAPTSPARTCPGAPTGGVFGTATKTAHLANGNAQVVEAVCSDQIVSGGFSIDPSGDYKVRANGPNGNSWRTVFDVSGGSIDVVISAVCLS